MLIRTYRVSLKPAVDVLWQDRHALKKKSAREREGLVGERETTAEDPWRKSRRDIKKYGNSWSGYSAHREKEWHRMLKIVQEQHLVGTDEVGSEDESTVCSSKAKTGLAWRVFQISDGYYT